MKKNLKKLLSVILTAVMVLTVCHTAITGIVSLAADGNSVLVNFEAECDVAWSGNAEVGKMEVQSDIKSEGSQAFLRDWGYRPLRDNMFIIKRESKSNFDLSDADILSLDFYISGIENWKKVYEDIAYILIAEEGFSDTKARYEAIKIPCNLKQGWNTLQINLAEVDLNLEKVAAFCFTHSDKWTNNGENPAYTSSEDECNVTLCVDNIRKIKGGKDTFAPYCVDSGIYTRNIGATHITLGFGQFADNVTLKEDITYEVTLGTEKLTKENVESAPFKKTVTGILGATVMGLESETKYYAAVKATDKAGNSEYLFSKSVFTTKKDEGAVTVDFLTFENSSAEGFGPPYVPQGAAYTTAHKTQGNSALGNTLKKRNFYHNLIVAYRKNGAADLSKCNYLLLDFYIDDIDVFNKYWKDRCYVMISDEDVKQGVTSSYVSYAVTGDLKEGWNALSFPLDASIDLSKVWTLRVSTDEKWINSSDFKQESDSCAVYVAIDNVRGQSASIDEDKNPPAFAMGDLKISEYRYDGFNFTFSAANDTFSPQNTLVYKVYASKEKITKENVKDLTAIKTFMDTNKVSLHGLDSLTNYYVAIEATDEAGNKGYYFTENPIKTQKDNYVYTPFLQCELTDEEYAGPDWVTNGYSYDLVNKTEGDASVTNIVTKRDVYYNLTNINRKNSPIDLSACNVLTLDFYIDDIEVFDKYWRNHLYVMITDEEGNVAYASSYLSFAIGGNLKSGWNKLQFALTDGIDLRNVWSLRISPVANWTNDTVWMQKEDGCELRYIIDNVRGERIGVEDDEVAPVFTGSTISTTRVTSKELTILWSEAKDAITPKEKVEYEVYVSGEKITKENVSSLSVNQKVKGKNTALIKNLKASSDYYFAVKAIDEAGNGIWLFYDEPFTTESRDGYVLVPFLQCEKTEEEVAGPDWVNEGYFYNTDIKTEGTASLSNHLSKRDVFYNLTMAHRKNASVDFSECNVLSLDFYIDDIEVFDKYWRDHCYIMLTDVPNIGNNVTSSSITFEVSGDLKSGWNSLQFPLTNDIDLSEVWSLRISPIDFWDNTPFFTPSSEDAKLLIAIDNVRGEKLRVADDKLEPKFDYDYIRPTYLGNGAATVAYAPAADNLTLRENLKYELYLSESEITEENLSQVTNVTKASNTQKITVKGLKAETEYYYAVRAFDGAGNASRLLTSATPLKTLKTKDDHWYLVSDAERKSGLDIIPDVGVPNVPYFSTEITTEGETAVAKKMAEGDVWGNMVQLNLMSEVSFATRMDFKLYIESKEIYEKYWYEHLYFVIGDEWGQAAAYKMPETLEEGWNDISVSLYGQSVDLTAISAVRITPVGGIQNEGGSVKLEEGIDKSLLVAIDEITAVYDPSVLPTVAPSDDAAFYITACDGAEDEGYWNVGVTYDEFEKTEGNSSAYKKFGYGQLSANAMNFTTAEPLDMSDATELRFDLYISNAALLKNRTQLAVKLGSTEYFDKAYLLFNMPIETLQTGWNQVVIDVDDAIENRIGFNLGKIRTFSFYCIDAIFLKGEEIEIRLDNVRMTGEFLGTGTGDDVILVPEDVYVTDEEVIITETNEYVKPDPIKKIIQKTILHKKGLPLYMWLLAIGVPALTGLVLLAALIIILVSRKKKRNKTKSI